MNADELEDCQLKKKKSRSRLYEKNVNKSGEMSFF